MNSRMELGVEDRAGNVNLVITYLTQLGNTNLPPSTVPEHYDYG